MDILPAARSDATMKLLSALAFCCGLVIIVASDGLPAGAKELAPTNTLANAACSSSVGPGIPPPLIPSDKVGQFGFHAGWYGQSGYMTLCPGDTSTATVAIYNVGSFGWVRSTMGQAAYLGTWMPIPGQDQPSVLGGDGTNGSPATGWPRYNRVAAQPASYVGPSQVGWFQFAVQAPTIPGSYRLYIRPLIEGAQWMEDFGIYWQVTVLNTGVGIKTTTSFNPTSIVANGTSTSVLTVTIQDANGNTATSDSSTNVTITRSSGAGVCVIPGLPGSASLSGVAQFGVASFNIGSTTTPGTCQWDVTTTPALTGSSATLKTQ